MITKMQAQRNLDRLAVRMAALRHEVERLEAGAPRIQKVQIFFVEP